MRLLRNGATFAGEVLASIRDALRSAPAPGRGERWALAGVVAVAAAVRGLYLREPIRFDEAASALYYSDRGILHALGGLAGNANHNLQSLLAWVTLRLFGWSEVAVRLPTFLAGIALPPILWASTRRWTASPTAALLAAAFAATSPGLVFFSVNGRGYGLQALIVALLVAVLLAALERPTPAAAVAAGFLTALGAFAVSTMLVFAVGLALGFLALSAGESRSRAAGARFTARWATASILAAVPLFAVAAIAHGPRGLLGHVPKMAEPVAQAVAGSATAFVAVFQLLWDWDDARFAVAAAAFLVAGLVLARGASARLGILAAGVAAAGLALTPLTGVGLLPRTLLPLAAILILWAAIGLEAFTRRRRVLQALAIGGVLVLYPAAWIDTELLRRHDATGDVPEGRALARALLAREDLASSLVALPPLYDIVVAFYFREAGVDRGGLYGFDLGFDPTRSCRATALLLYRTAEEEAGAVTVRAAPWSARLGFPAPEEEIAGTTGRLVRIPLAPCESSS